MVVFTPGTDGSFYKYTSARAALRVRRVRA